MERDAIENFPGAGERHQDVDQAKAVAGERNSQPDMWHLETDAGTKSACEFIISAQASRSGYERLLLAKRGLRRRASYGQDYAWYESPWSSHATSWPLVPGAPALCVAGQIPRANAFYREQSCAFFEAVEGFCPEPLHFQQFLPMSEVAVALAVAHDVVGNVFGDAGQLGQFLRAGGIQIDDVSHRNPLDGGSKR